MENPFCSSRERVLRLFLASRRSFARNLFLKFLKKCGRKEIAKQLNNEAGEIVDAINSESNVSARKTENVEVMTALQLSDFYFPHNETEICFAMRRNIDINRVQSYEDLVSGFENATHVDCSIRSADKHLSFQIKRYPQEYLLHTNEAFLDWFRNDVISHYGNMKGTILSIILQPNVFEETALHFSSLASSLEEMKDIITFDEVVLIYNDHKKQLLALHEIFPEHKRKVIPLDWALKRFRGEV